jgi:UDP-N-acetylglucosamine 1-carboxyvinyltransferase
LAAAEPHVQDLCNFLNACGAKIDGIGTNTLKIEGVDKMHGAKHVVIPDQIEAGTFAVLGAVTKGTLEITGLEPNHLDIVFLTLNRAGVNFEIRDKTMIIPSQSSLKAFKLKTMPYPNFPTDLQASFGVLATQCGGTSLIHDPLFEGRLGYINELAKMGANAVICDPHRVLVTGPTPLYSQEIRGLDLRGGACLVIAGLIAKGETILYGAEIIDRGYENLDGRLKEVGADITRQ